MSLYNGPPRGGARGGKDQFNWEDVKTDKFRENYLGASVHASVGRWQKGRDILWYTREKDGGDSSLQDELTAVKQREEDLMLEALGMKPKIRKPVEMKARLDANEMKSLLQRGGPNDAEEEGPPTAAQEDPDAVRGLGFAAPGTIKAMATLEGATETMAGTVDTSQAQASMHEGRHKVGSEPGRQDRAMPPKDTDALRRLRKLEKKAAKRTKKEADKAKKKKKKQDKKEKKERRKVEKSCRSPASSDDSHSDKSSPPREIQTRRRPRDESPGPREPARANQPDRGQRGLGMDRPFDGERHCPDHNRAQHERRRQDREYDRRDHHCRKDYPRGEDRNRGSSRGGRRSRSRSRSRSPTRR